MTNQRKLKYRYFFLSFTLAFLLLSLLFYILMSTVQPGAFRSLDGEINSIETSSYLPSRSDSLTVLFVGVDPGGNSADTFLLAQFNPAGGSVPIVAFPRQTAVWNNDKTETLEQLYRYGGADYTRTCLAKSLGITIDRYVRIDTSAFVVAANTVGTVEFDLTHSLTIQKDGAMPMTLAEGIQLLDGQTAADIIHFSEYDGGELTRCSIVADLTAAIVNQRIDIVQSTMVDKVFEKIINLIDTDISYADYDDRKEAASFLAKLGQDPARPMQASGAYSPDGETYTLSDTFIALLTQTFV